MKKTVTNDNYTISESMQVRDIAVDNDKMLDTLFAKLYTKPIYTPVKEYISNAIDATIEAGKPLSTIMITTPSVANPFLTIRDYANGMSEDFFNNTFLTAGKSTAETDMTKNGNYGIGSKAWFATQNDEFFYDIFYNGSQFSYMLFKKNGKYGSIKQGEFKTKEPNGLQVRLPCKKEQILEIKQAVFSNLFYIKDKIKVNNELAPNYTDTLVFENDELIVHQEIDSHTNEGLSVIVGYFAYVIPQKDKSKELISNESDYHNVLVFKKAIGSLSIPPSREYIIEDTKLFKFRDSLKAIISENQKSIDKNISLYYEKLIKSVVK
jgi:hypothetical protein